MIQRRSHKNLQMTFKGIQVKKQHTRNYKMQQKQLSFVMVNVYIKKKKPPFQILTFQLKKLEK